MRAGIVVTTRINPKDCQSVLDLMQLIGFDPAGQSFSQLCALAMASLLETQRQAGILPEPDPFKFMDRLQYYKGSKNTKKHSAVARIVQETGPRFKAPVMPAASSAVPTPTMGTLPVERVSGDVREARVRLAELHQKLGLSQDNPTVTWSRTDQEEYDGLYKVVYPYG